MEKIDRLFSEDRALPPNVLVSNCPSRYTLDVIADKWTAMIFAILERHPTHFNELRRTIGGISHKMLAQTLRTLEKNGIVERREFQNGSSSVTYSLSPLGTTLSPLMASLHSWAEHHVEDVQQAHERYQERPTSSLSC